MANKILTCLWDLLNVTSLLQGPFRALVVTETSGRRDVDSFTLLEDDHMSICKPKDTSAQSYVILKDFIIELVPKR